MTLFNNPFFFAVVARSNFMFDPFIYIAPCGVHFFCMCVCVNVFVCRKRVIEHYFVCRLKKAASQRTNLINSIFFLSPLPFGSVDKFPKVDGKKC